MKLPEAIAIAFHLRVMTKHSGYGDATIGMTVRFPASGDRPITEVWADGGSGPQKIVHHMKIEWPKETPCSASPAAKKIAKATSRKLKSKP